MGRDETALPSAMTSDPAGLLVGLDFDGTLAPIVDDPTVAFIHPDAPGLLARLGSRIGGLAIVTGRPVRQVLALGGFEALGAEVVAAGGRFCVLGQYGNERWDASTRRTASPLPPKGLATFLSELPSLLRAAGSPDAYVEAKGLAVAVHTRRLPDPVQAYAAVLPLLTAAAHVHGLSVEPGRHVVEVRAPGMDKGIAVRRLVAEWQPTAVLYVGDDLGDVEAFKALRALRAGAGQTAHVVAAHTGDGPAELLDLADSSVDGPDGLVALLRTLVELLERAPLN